MKIYYIQVIKTSSLSISSFLSLPVLALLSSRNIYSKPITLATELAYNPWNKVGIYETMMRTQEEKQKGEARREEGRREGGCKAGMVGS